MRSMAQKSQFLGQLVNDGLFFSILYHQLEVFFSLKARFCYSNCSIPSDLQLRFYYIVTVVQDRPNSSLLYFHIAWKARI